MEAKLCRVVDVNFVEIPFVFHHDFVIMTEELGNVL